MLARRWSLAVSVLLAVSTAACSGDSSTDELRPAVGFIFVGERDDLGYNQAAWEGHEAVARAFPDLDVVGVENVPESDAAVEVLEGLIDRGARVLFATSFGHRDAAFEVARRHRDVVVVHQGGVEPHPPLDNFGTYFGAHSEAMYAAGIASGADSRTGRLGFVGAFPIPATYNNVNAFLLGARSVRPDATLEVVLTEDWCDPGAQRRAAELLIERGTEVIAQHQDCTGTILEVAESAGIGAVGYHSDGSEVAPRSWLTGPVWTWADLYIDIVDEATSGGFATSRYNGDYRGTLATGDNPFVLAEFGPRMTPGAAELVAAAIESFRADERAVFVGPILDLDGVERVGPGRSLGKNGVDEMDYFVSGVTVLSR